MFISIKILICGALFIAFIGLSVCGFEDIECVCGVGYNSTLTAYYPDYGSENVSDYTDMKGKKLRTLQDFLDGRAEFVTAAIDQRLNLPYGTSVCIPELNRHYRRRIFIEVRDTDTEFDNLGVSRIDVCVRSEADSYDVSINRPVKLIIENSFW